MEYLNDKLTHCTASEEAARCLLCHDAPCSKGCPDGIDPAKFIRSIRFKNIEGAIDAVCRNDTAAAACEWECPYGGACEGSCVRRDIDRPVGNELSPQQSGTESDRKFIEKLHRYVVRESVKHHRMPAKKDLSVEFLGVRCENPFFLASSPVAGNYEMVAKAFEAGWGGVFFKTVGIFKADECSPRFDSIGKGGPPWIGFKNMEQISDKPLETNLEYIRKLKRDYPDKIVAASIMGSSEDEWKTLARMCEQAGADLLEGNFSCPQMTVQDMGSDVGANPELVSAYTKAVTETVKIPFIAKMTPNITDMTVPAVAAVESGAMGISAINTVKSIAGIDFERMTGTPVIDGKSSISGYSGAAVKPIALRFIAQLGQNGKLRNAQISGIGGIETWRDAAEFLLLGCRNVQVATAVMQYGYRIVEDMASGLAHFMDEYGFDRLDDFIGRALPNIIPAEEINRDHIVFPRFNANHCAGCGRCYISCRDAAHQAIAWDDAKRRPLHKKENCAGCHLCLNVCPVQGCIVPGEIKRK